MEANQTMPRELDSTMLVDGQIHPHEIAALKEQGVTLVINNRPDGEEPGQPTSEQIEKAASAAGIAYRHVPIRRGMGPSDIELMREALRAAGDGKVLAFCRTGTRSTMVWALACNEEGRPRDELEACARQAGYSLEPISHLLD